MTVFLTKPQVARVGLLAVFAFFLVAAGCPQDRAPVAGEGGQHVEG